MSTETLITGGALEHVSMDLKPLNNTQLVRFSLHYPRHYTEPPPCVSILKPLPPQNAILRAREKGLRTGVQNVSFTTYLHSLSRSC